MYVRFLLRNRMRLIKNDDRDIFWEGPSAPVLVYATEKQQILVIRNRPN